MLVSVFSVVTLAVASVVAAPQKGYSYQPEPVDPLRTEEATLQEQVLEPESTNLVDDHHHDHDHHDHHVGLEWLRDSVPGEPGEDYPIYWEIPNTSFRCRGRQPGYYADVETRCQVFHICNRRGGQAFLCPNGTIFDQEHFTCKWWFSVSCQDSEGFFDLNNNIGAAAEQNTQVIDQGFGQKKTQETQQIQEVQQVAQEVQPIVLPDQIPTNVEGVLEISQPIPQQPQEPEEINAIIEDQKIATGSVAVEVEDATIRQVINQLLNDQQNTHNNELDGALERPTSCGEGSVDCVARPSEGVSQLYGVPALNAGESIPVQVIPQEPQTIGGVAAIEGSFVVPGVSAISQENHAIIQDEQDFENELSHTLSAAPRFDDPPPFPVSHEGISTFEQYPAQGGQYHGQSEGQTFNYEEQPIVKEEQVPEEQFVTISTFEEQFPGQAEEQFPAVFQGEEQNPILDEQNFIQEEQVFEGLDQVTTQLPILTEEQYTTIGEEQEPTETVNTEEPFPAIPVQEDQSTLQEEIQEQIRIQGENQIITTQFPIQEEHEYDAKVQEDVPLQPAVELRTQGGFPMQWRIRPSYEIEEVQDEELNAINHDGQSTNQLEEEIAVHDEIESTTQTVEFSAQPEEQFETIFEEKIPVQEQEEPVHVQLEAGEQLPLYYEEPVPVQEHEQVYIYNEGQTPIQGEEVFPILIEETLPVDVEEQFSITTSFPEQFADDETFEYATEFPVVPQTVETPHSKLPSTFIIEFPSEIIEAPADVSFTGVFNVPHIETQESVQSDVAGVTSLPDFQSEDIPTEIPVILETEQSPENSENNFGIAVNEYTPELTQGNTDQVVPIEQLEITQVKNILAINEESENSSTSSSEETIEDTGAVTTTSSVDRTQQNEIFQEGIQNIIPVRDEEAQVDVIPHQIPQLYEAPDTHIVTEESVAVTVLPTIDEELLPQLTTGDLEVDSSSFAILPEVNPEGVSISDVPQDSVVSLIQKGENDRQNKTSVLPQATASSTDGTANVPFAQDEYTTIIPEAREETTAIPYEEEDTTFLPLENEEETSSFVITADEETTTYPAVLSEEPVSYESVHPEQVPKEPITFEQVPQEPVSFGQIPQEPASSEQVPQEPVTFEQVPQEPTIFDQIPQEPATYDQVPQEPAVFEQFPQEPATFEQIPQEPAIFEQVPREPAVFEQVPEKPAVYEQVPQEPAVFEQIPQEPAVFEQVPQEPAVFEQVPQEPAVFEQIPQEPAVFEQVPQEPEVFEQIPQEPATFEQVPHEPITLEQVPQEPVTFEQVPQEPATFEQVPREPATFEQIPEDPAIFEQVPQEPITFEQVPQEPTTFEQIPQEPAVFEQIPQEPATFEQVPQEPATFEQVPQEPVTFEQIPEEPATFEQVPQEPATFEQVPQEPVTFEQIPEEPATFEQVPQEPATFEQVPQEPVTYEQIPEEPATFEQVPQEPATFEQVPQEPFKFDQSFQQSFPEFPSAPEEANPPKGYRAHQTPPLIGLYLPPHA